MGTDRRVEGYVIALGTGVILALGSGKNLCVVYGIALYDTIIGSITNISSIICEQGQWLWFLYILQLLDQRVIHD